MISITTIYLIAGAGAIFIVIVLLVVLIIRASSENKRLKEEQEARKASPSVPSPATVNMPQGPQGTYSYASVVMDEVVEEKIIEGLKESLRMTDEMYKKLSEKFKDDRDRRIELANDWLNYLEAIDTIKQARIDYRMNSTDGESVRVERDSVRVKMEIENKFKNLQQTVPTPAAG